MISFAVLGHAISENMAYPTNKMGRRFLCKKGEVWKEQIAWGAKQAKITHEKEMGEAVKPAHYILRMDHNWYIELDFYFDDNRKRDAQNYEKLVFDALKDILYNDDSQVLCHKTTKKFGEPKLIIRMEVMK